MSTTGFGMITVLKMGTTYFSGPVFRGHHISFDAQNDRKTSVIFDVTELNKKVIANKVLKLLILQIKANL